MPPKCIIGLLILHLSGKNFSSVGARGPTLPPLFLPPGLVLLPPPLDLGGRVEEDPLVWAGGKGVEGRDEGSTSHAVPLHRAAPLSWP